MAKIKSIHAREVLDAKGNPTIEAVVTLSDNATGIAACPSGTSVGKYEATELRDGDMTHYLGLGVQKAIHNIETIIAPKLVGFDAQKQPEIDRLMIDLDGTQNKGRLGANATLSVSMAVAKAGARSSVLPLFLYLRQFTKIPNQPSDPNQRTHIPTPVFNLINGGKHAGGNLDFQEFMVIPATSKSYSESLQIGFSIYKKLHDLLVKNSFSTLIGDEGGFAPSLPSNEDALSLLMQAVENAGYRFGYEVFTGMDVASNSFYKDGQYHLKESTTPKSADDMIELYQKLIKDYNVIYLEDPLSEDAWDDWNKLFSKVGTDTIVVGDDLTATNPYRLQMALDKKTISGIIIKPNQIGTVIEALAVVEVARLAGLKICVSHRSGETNDDFIADFAVAVSSDYLKFGAPARGERVAKYNRLLQIEQQLIEI